jgi:hypothetical protein
MRESNSREIKGLEQVTKELVEGRTGVRRPSDDDLWPCFHRVRPRTDVLEPLPSIAPDCHHIVGIDTEVNALAVVCIER